MIISNLLKDLETQLTNASIEEPRLEAELLIRGSLHYDKTDLLLNLDSELSLDAIEDIQNRLQLRLSGEPAAYILGYKEFYNRNFKVNHSVLIPRPETEIMVEDAIQEFKNQECTILDLCTGSGCIATTLALELPKAKIFASDISNEALEVAKKNAELNHTNVTFIKSDLLKDIPYTFDAILSNPPYVPTADMPDSHEPILALDGGTTGLDIIERLLPELPIKLKDNGICWIEMAINHYPLVEKLALQNYAWKSVKPIKDLAGIDRFIKLNK